MKQRKPNDSTVRNTLLVIPDAPSPGVLDPTVVVADPPWHDLSIHVRHKDKIYDINKDLSFQRILGASE